LKLLTLGLELFFGLGNLGFELFGLLQDHLGWCGAFGSVCFGTGIGVILSVVLL
jgi:hypothetical protein